MLMSGSRVTVVRLSAAVTAAAVLAACGSASDEWSSVDTAEIIRGSAASSDRGAGPDAAWDGILAEQGGCIVLMVGDRVAPIVFFSDTELVQHDETGELGVRPSADGDFVISLGDQASGAGGFRRLSELDSIEVPDACADVLDEDAEAAIVASVDEDD